MKTKKDKVYIHVILMILVIITLFPIVFALSNSFKTLQESFNSTLTLIPREFTFENYKYVFSRIPLFKIILNTFTIAAVVTIVKTFTSILAAYSFVYYEFKAKNTIYLIFLTTMFIPFTVTMIPNYLIVSRLKLTDTIWGVMLPQFADVIGIFMLRQAMRTIPKSIIEASKIDGINESRTLKDIILPLIRPSIISSSIIFFINSWNEYVRPVLIISSKENYTLSLALQMFISSEGGTDFPIAMAVSVITMIIPLILFLIFQRHIMSTFISSGVK
jgi:sn-glycerol 3-phosphate transport system permease protein